jgi:hypothetical protein
VTEGLQTSGRNASTGRAGALVLHHRTHARARLVVCAHTRRLRKKERALGSAKKFLCERCFHHLCAACDACVPSLSTAAATRVGMRANAPARCSASAHRVLRGGPQSRPSALAMGCWTRHRRLPAAQQESTDRRVASARAATNTRQLNPRRINQPINRGWGGKSVEMDRKAGAAKCAASEDLSMDALLAECRMPKLHRRIRGGQS